MIAVDNLSNIIVLHIALFKNGMAIGLQSETEVKMLSATIMFI